MPGKRIKDLTALSGAASANNDDLLIFDSGAGETKRISRSQLAEGMVGDLPLQYYLGVLNANPTQRLNGDALQIGDFYLDAVTKYTVVYNGSGWNSYASVIAAQAAAEAARDAAQLAETNAEAAQAGSEAARDAAVAAAEAARDQAEDSEVAKAAAQQARDQAQTAAANAQASALTCATWAVLSTLTGSTAGVGAEVLDADTGTHTDPVVGGTVSNAGRYTWSASPAGWKRIGGTGLSGKVGYADGIATADAPAEYDENGIELRRWGPSAEMIVSGDVYAAGRKLTGLPSDIEVIDGASPAQIAADGIIPLSLDTYGRLVAVPSPIFARQCAALASAPVDMDAIVSRDDIVLFGDSIIAPGSGWGDGLAAALGGTRSVTNRGIGGQDTRQILQRQGGYPIPVAAVTIPASGSVAITLTDGDPYYGHGGTYGAMLAGVAGTVAPTATLGQWTFTRSASGAAVDVTAGTPVVLTEQETFRASTLILQPGPNISLPWPDTRQQWQPWLDKVAGAIDHLTPRVKRFALVGEYTGREPGESDAAASVRATSLRIYNTMLREMVGEEHYIDFDSYVTQQAIYEAISLGLLAAGTYPTAQDLADMAASICPVSLRSDGVHPNATLKTLLARHVARHIRAKGI